MAVPPDNPSGPFEGPEKLLEIWFAQSPADVPFTPNVANGKFGLRAVPQQTWQDMLDVVKCKILSVVEGTEIDAYLLRVILKTCGTTLNLLGVPRILQIAKDAGLPSVYRCFYSRKAFMFPDRQPGPHRDWKAEVEYLDAIFPNGSAYTIGKMNGDHWLLYLTNPHYQSRSSSSASGSVPGSPTLDRHLSSPVDFHNLHHRMSYDAQQDYTIEILMTHLSATARDRFFPCPSTLHLVEDDPTAHAKELSFAIGITDLFPAQLTTLDAYSFSPCGYSSNALIKYKEDAGADPSRCGEGYYTIHVTPEEGWSYASFECNVPLPPHLSNATASVKPGDRAEIPDLKTLIRRVVRIFQPGTLTLTLFISSEGTSSTEDEETDSAVELAQRAFKAALTSPVGCDKPTCGVANGESGCDFNRAYRRTDKINYEFGGYDLAFATFEMCT